MRKNCAFTEVLLLAHSLRSEVGVYYLMTTSVSFLFHALQIRLSNQSLALPIEIATAKSIAHIRGRTFCALEVVECGFINPCTRFRLALAFFGRETRLSNSVYHVDGTVRSIVGHRATISSHRN
jgi:hypothetical protein